MQVCFPFAKFGYFSFMFVYFHTRVSLISFLQLYFILCFDFFPVSVIYFMQARCVWFAQICFKYVIHLLGSCDQKLKKSIIIKKNPLDVLNPRH
jgi:hypothetical protein